MHRLLLLLPLLLCGCLDTALTYTVAADGSGEYACVLTVSPGAVAVARSSNLEDDPDTPFAAQRTAVLQALHAGGFAQARLTAREDTAGLHLRLQVPVADARHLAAVEEHLAAALPGMPRGQFALVPAGDRWQAQCRIVLEPPRGESALGLAFLLDAVARADSAPLPDTAGFAEIISQLAAGRAVSVRLVSPDTAAAWQMPLAALFAAHNPVRTTLVVPPAMLPLPTATPAPAVTTLPPADTVPALVRSALQRGNIEGALRLARQVCDRDRREALYETIGNRYLAARNLPQAEGMLMLLESPGRRARLRSEIEQTRARAAADVVTMPEDARPSDTWLLPAAEEYRRRGHWGDAIATAVLLRDTFTRDALLLNLVNDLLGAGEIDAAARLVPHLTADLGTYAAGRVADARASAERQEAVRRQVTAVEQALHAAPPAEALQFADRAAAVSDTERRAYLQAAIAFRHHEHDFAAAVAYARAIADTVSHHRANVLAALATIAYDGGDTATGDSILAEAVAGAANIAHASDRLGVLGYCAAEYAARQQADRARTLVRRVLPELAALPAAAEAEELDRRWVAAEWCATAGTALRDGAVVDAALSLIGDAQRRAQVQQHLAGQDR